MENNQRNSRKRLNSLVLLVAFTAVMLIVSTYAWFSAQKNVTLGGLKGIVKVAEGLEISLDAKHWSQEVDFSKFDTDQTALRKIYGVAADGTPSGNTYDDNNLHATDDVEHNIIPTELLPVSTTGTDGNGIGLTDMNMYRGLVKSTGGVSSLNTVITVLKGTNLTTAYPVTAGQTETVIASSHDYPGYYAIDFFLKNSTSTSEAGTTNYSEPLQLNTNSKVELLSSAANTYGLQNTVRVGFAMFNALGTVAPDSTADTNSTAGDDLDWAEHLKTATVSNHMSASQLQILNAYKGQNIRDVAIWEPNASDHADAIYENVGEYAKGKYPKISKADAKLFIDADATEGIQGMQYGASTPYSKVGAMRTYALTSEAATAGSVTEIYNWGGKLNEGVEVSPDSGLAPQVTLQTEKTSTTNFAITGGIKNLVSVTSPTTVKYTRGDEGKATAGDTTDDAKTLNMGHGTVCKVRMYVWLEGQDVDTINHASHGGGVHLDVGLLKDGDVGSEGVS